MEIIKIPKGCGLTEFVASIFESTNVKASVDVYSYPQSSEENEVDDYFFLEGISYLKHCADKNRTGITLSTVESICPEHQKRRVIGSRSGPFVIGYVIEFTFRYGTASSQGVLLIPDETELSLSGILSI